MSDPVPCPCATRLHAVPPPCNLGPARSRGVVVCVNMLPIWCDTTTDDRRATWPTGARFVF
eukprot:1651052-Prymnesium_polylepis.1